MPIYEYRCNDCRHQAEVLQKLSDAPLSACPACGKASFKKLLSAPGFQLTGSGWYATDFKGGAKPAEKTESQKPETPSASTPATSGCGTSCACH